MPNAITLADAITTELNATSFSQAFSATREYSPVFALQDTDALTVVVVPVTRESSMISRAADAVIYGVQVGVLYKFANEISCDNLLSLCEEIADHFRKKTLASIYFCTERIIDPLFDAEWIVDNKQFASIITLKFKVLG